MPDAPAPEWCFSTGRCFRWLLREPPPPAWLQNWFGSLRTLTVPAKRVGGVCAGGCELACSSRRYQPLRGASLAYGFACWPSSSSSASAPRLSRCLHHHKPGARGRAGGDLEEAVDVDSNASFAREVERNVSSDNDFSLRGS